MNENVLDLNEFLQRVQEDKELLVELLDIFSEDFAGKRKSLGEAVTQEDYEQVRNIAHSLKGASGNISAKNLREIFMKVEDMGKRGEFQNIEQLMSEADKEFEMLSGRILEVKEQYQT